MSPLGFEPTTLVFEWVKAVHALDHVVTLISIKYYSFGKFCSCYNRVELCHKTDVLK
jgi:hypothetical protein